MANSIRFFTFFVSLACAVDLFGQALPDTLTTRQQFMTEVGGFGASATQTPFWFRSRQYGTIPLNGPAGLVRAGFAQQFGDLKDPHNVHVKVAVEGVFSGGATSRVILPVAYASLLFKNFELYAGRRREIFGLVDTLLSSGSYAWSGNALPLYKIQLGTRGFVPIGFTKGVLAINALFAHGWFSNTDSVQHSFLHQKALFARLSLAKGRVNLYGGLTHLVQWGGRSEAIGYLAPHGQIPSSFTDYLNVVFVRKPPADTTQYSQFDSDNQVGNHLGSIDFTLEINASQSNWYLYYQHPYEDKSGVAFQNMPDGLYGIRWKNQRSKQGFQLKQVTLEFLTTLDQSGFTKEIGDRLYNGADDYFNNGQFVDGWTHKQRVIGTPFITRWLDSRADLRDLKGGNPWDGRYMISNNRVQVGHLGLRGQWPSGVQLWTLLSFSKNFGRPISSDPRMPLSQFSGLAKLYVPMQWLKGSQLCLAIASDQGKWLPENIGGWVSLKKVIQR